MKKIKKIVVTLIICCLSLQLVACGSNDKGGTSSDEMPDKIRIGYFQVPNDELIAMSENLFKNMECKVETVEFNSGKDVNNALASNSIDLGYMGTVPAASGIASGLNYEVCWMHAVLNDIECLIAKNDSGISSVKDLKGKKVAVVIGSTSHYSLLNAMKDSGLSENDVTLLNGSPAEINAMWQRGDVEAAYIWEPTLSNFKEDGTIIFTGKDSQDAGALTGTVEVVNKDFGKKYPKAVAEYIKTLVKAQNMYRDDKDKVLNDVAKKLEITIDAAQTQLEGSTWLSVDEQLSSDYFGKSNNIGGLAKILKDTGDFLEDQGSIASSPSLDKYKKAINPSYLEMVKESKE